MNKIVVKLGERIRALRKMHKLTQEQLAEKANLHPTYIGQIERGETSATIGIISRIADAFSIRLAELFDFPSGNGPITRKQLLIDEIATLLKKEELKNVELIKAVVVEVLKWTKRNQQH